MRLSHEKIVVVVASVSPCSRPDPLKVFLYLDFFDKERRKPAWDMLIKTMSKQCITRKGVLLWNMQGKWIWLSYRWRCSESHTITFQAKV